MLHGSEKSVLFFKKKKRKKPCRMNSSWLQSGFVHSSRPCFSLKAFLIERDSWFQCRKAAQSLPDRKPLRPTCFKAQQHTWENDLVNDILLSSSDLLHNFVLSSFFPPFCLLIYSVLFCGCFRVALRASVLRGVPLKSTSLWGIIKLEPNWSELK